METDQSLTWNQVFLRAKCCLTQCIDVGVYHSKREHAWEVMLTSIEVVLSTPFPFSMRSIDESVVEARRLAKSCVHSTGYLKVNQVYELV